MRLTTLLLAACLLGGCLMDAQHAPTAGFDGARAFAHLQAVVRIGPRPAGSPGAARTRDYIQARIDALGLSLERQPFDARTPIGTVPMVNLRVRVNPSRPGPRLIVAGHYDTKRFDDRTFVGANDAGSSTAFLLELARVLARHPGRWPVDLVFFDGEEAVVEWKGDDHTYGSRHFVERARADGTLAAIGALVLVDMIGERSPRFLRDVNSTGWLTDIIWTHARALGRTEFVDAETAIEDDHLRFLEAGVPAVDIIDLEYPAWHTADDTIDKVAPESLQAVGDVLLAALPEIVSRIQGRGAPSPRPGSPAR